MEVKWVGGHCPCWAEPVLKGMRPFTASLAQWNTPSHHFGDFHQSKNSTARRNSKGGPCFDSTAWYWMTFNSCRNVPLAKCFLKHNLVITIVLVGFGEEAEINKFSQKMSQSICRSGNTHFLFTPLGKKSPEAMLQNNEEVF